jgi:hypothetical protein
MQCVSIFLGMPIRHIYIYIIYKYIIIYIYTYMYVYIYIHQCEYLFICGICSKDWHHLTVIICIWSKKETSKHGLLRDCVKLFSPNGQQVRIQQIPNIQDHIHLETKTHTHTRTEIMHIYINIYTPIQKNNTKLTMYKTLFIPYIICISKYI